MTCSVNHHLRSIYFFNVGKYFFSPLFSQAATASAAAVPPSMEVIVYPSGQLLKGADPDSPPPSTIGPLLESALLQHYYRDQLPHYVLAKSKRRMELEVREKKNIFPQACSFCHILTFRFFQGDTDLFDPTVESDELDYNLEYFDQLSSASEEHGDAAAGDRREDVMEGVAATAASAVSAAGGLLQGFMRYATRQMSSLSFVQNWWIFFQVGPGRPQAGGKRHQAGPELREIGPRKREDILQCLTLQYYCCNSRSVIHSFGQRIRRR